MRVVSYTESTRFCLGNFMLTAEAPTNLENVFDKGDTSLSALTSVGLALLPGQCCELEFWRKGTLF